MLFIFDWDGTLSDSTQKIIDCMHRASAEQGLPVLSDLAVKDIIGLGLPEAIGRLYPELSSRDVELMRSGYARHFVEADQIPSAFFPTVMETLEHLLAQGHQIAVATGKSRQGFDRVLSNLQLDDFFHGSRCADETASKPHPLMLQELVTELQVPVTQAVMVGDTEFDMEMARRANMARIAVDYGAHHISRLESYEPLMSISEMQQILDVALPEGR